jgi:prevent-host-death family protein
MKMVSMVEFRRNTAKILGQVQRGHPIVLTYRGKPVARLEPIGSGHPSPEDPFYELAQLASNKGRSITNEQIDRIVYGT